MNVTPLESETGSAVPAEKEGGMRLSMHNGVAVSCDCCSCEAEPYWLALAEEPGIDPADSETAHAAAPQKK